MKNKELISSLSEYGFNIKNGDVIYFESSEEEMTGIKKKPNLHFKCKGIIMINPDEEAYYGYGGCRNALFNFMVSIKTDYGKMIARRIYSIWTTEKAMDEFYISIGIGSLLFRK